jgi:hypothetical protein
MHTFSNEAPCAKCREPPVLFAAALVPGTSRSDGGPSHSMRGLASLSSAGKVRSVETARPTRGTRALPNPPPATRIVVSDPGGTVVSGTVAETSHKTTAPCSASRESLAVRAAWDDTFNTRVFHNAVLYWFFSSRKLKSKLNSGWNDSLFPCSKSLMPGWRTVPKIARTLFTSGCSCQTENASILTTTSRNGS